MADIVVKSAWLVRIWPTTKCRHFN